MAAGKRKRFDMEKELELKHKSYLSTIRTEWWTVITVILAIIGLGDGYIPKVTTHARTLYNQANRAVHRRLGPSHKPSAHAHEGKASASRKKGGVQHQGLVAEAMLPRCNRAGKTPEY